jgi:formamidopyrimidine-DNA glycosylase
MPELPEVETVRRGLQPHLEGARLARVEQNRADLRFPLPERFADRLTGARVEGLERRAKYLRARLDTGETLVAHLGMTGRFLVGTDQPGRFVHGAGDDPKHTHIVLHTEAGAAIAFNDARRFGYMDLIPTDALDRHPWFAGLGPEPLGPDFSADTLADGFAGRRQNVKASLLDQRIVAGLGNIYVCEALHRAGINPETPAGEVRRPKLKRLAGAIVEVLEAAIAAGGSTLRDYRNAEGSLGYFQHAFQVYGREDDPCLNGRCRGVVRRLVQGGRSTFFCAVCQR